jgi:hypothetical protein
VEEEDPWNGGWAKDEAAEEPARVAGASAAGREGTRRSEKAKVSEEALLTRSSKAQTRKPIMMNAAGLSAYLHWHRDEIRVTGTNTVTKHTDSESDTRPPGRRRLANTTRRCRGY